LNNIDCGPVKNDLEDCASAFNNKDCTPADKNSEDCIIESVKKPEEVCASTYNNDEEYARNLQFSYDLECVNGTLKPGDFYELPKVTKSTLDIFLENWHEEIQVKASIREQDRLTYKAYKRMFEIPDNQIIWKYILKFLDNNSKRRLFKVCKKLAVMNSKRIITFQNLIELENIWNQNVVKHLRIIVSFGNKFTPKSWHSLYKAFPGMKSIETITLSFEDLHDVMDYKLYVMEIFKILQTAPIILAGKIRIRFVLLNTNIEKGILGRIERMNKVATTKFHQSLKLKVIGKRKHSLSLQLSTESEFLYISY